MSRARLWSEVHDDVVNGVPFENLNQVDVQEIFFACIHEVEGYSPGRQLRRP